MDQKWARRSVGEHVFCFFKTSLVSQHVFEHDFSTFHLKLIQVCYDELKKSGLQNTDNFWRHPCGKINQQEARGQFPKPGFHLHFWTLVLLVSKLPFCWLSIRMIPLESHGIHVMDWMWWIELKNMSQSQLVISFQQRNLL